MSCQGECEIWSQCWGQSIVKMGFPVQFAHQLNTLGGRGVFLPGSQGTESNIELIKAQRQPRTQATRTEA